MLTRSWVQAVIIVGQQLFAEESILGPDGVATTCISRGLDACQVRRPISSCRHKTQELITLPPSVSEIEIVKPLALLGILCGDVITHCAGRQHECREALLAVDHK